LYSSPWKGGWWRLDNAVRYMQGASMAILDTAAKYLEQLLYNRYQAARDNIERFRKEPPFAYVIPREQRDLPEAATLVDKMLINGIEVHQAVKPFEPNGREYNGAWVILMDQPFAAVVKELFEPQHYPDLGSTPNGPPIRPYDVAGWTLPMQMGVETAAVLKPVSPEQRAGLRRIETVTPPTGAVEGSGSVYIIGYKANAGFQAINDIFAKGGKIGFTSDGSIVASGIDHDTVSDIARKRSLVLQAVTKAPDNVVASKKLRVGLCRSVGPEHRRRLDPPDTRELRLRADYAAERRHPGGASPGALRCHYLSRRQSAHDYGRLCDRIDSRRICGWCC
jgi:hypothetical protein